MRSFEGVFDNSVKALSDLWKCKYASKRIKNKPKLTNTLFYDDILLRGWDEVKDIYLKDVGR